MAKKIHLSIKLIAKNSYILKHFDSLRHPTPPFQVALGMPISQLKTTQYVIFYYYDNILLAGYFMIADILLILLSDY